MPRGGRVVEAAYFVASAIGLVVGFLISMARPGYEAGRSLGDRVYNWFYAGARFKRRGD